MMYSSLLFSLLAIFAATGFLLSAPRRRLSQMVLCYLIGLFCIWSVFIFYPGVIPDTSMKQLGAVIVLIAFSYLVIHFLYRSLRHLFLQILSRFQKRKHLAPYLEEICRAMEQMKSRKVGALIVLERKELLAKHLKSTFLLDSEIKAELLLSMFAVTSPIHDGAVIVNNGRIKAVKSVLPLSTRPDLPLGIGTRHRSGIGITEKTDAISLIVSEERGQISVAYRGNMVVTANTEELHKLIHTALRGKPISPKR